MDKNTVIGLVLIGVVLVLFMWMNKPTPEMIEAQRVQDSLRRVEMAEAEKRLPIITEEKNQEVQNIQTLPDSILKEKGKDLLGDFYVAAQGTQEYISLQNDELELKINTKGGAIEYARLKNYTTFDSLPVILFDDEDSRFAITFITANNRIVSSEQLYFQPIAQSDTSVIMRLNSSIEGSFIDLRYTLATNDYRVKMEILPQRANLLLSPAATGLDIFWSLRMRQQEQGRKFENQYSSLYYKYTSGDVENLSSTKSEKESISNRLRWIGFKDKFFASVMMSKEGFESSMLESSSLDEERYIKKMEAKTVLPLNVMDGKPSTLEFFFGPTRYSLLRSYDAGLKGDDVLELDRMVPMGGSLFRWINKWFIVPMFDFFGKFFTSYGLIILIITFIIKLILFPLTYKSYLSQAKMRVLRPQVQAINEKYPGNDKALERQKATMELYKRAGASTMGGCLPMLLQFPILVAMYWYFPGSIELRQQSFLWAKDLSTYDPVIQWSSHIPIISSILGNHISLFCLLMVIVNLIYTTYNMKLSDTGQQQMPGMKVMMYMMPLMFFFFFNQNASGLSYYYLVSTLITIVQTMVFRFKIDEDKLLAKMEANKKKPIKKSKWMQRLEAAQKMQEEQNRRKKQK